MENQAQTEIITHCSKHGDYNSRAIQIAGVKEIWTKCPKCHEVQEKLRTTNQCLPNWVSKRQKGNTFDNFKIVTEEQKNIWSRSKKYVENFKKVLEIGSCMAFLGSPGTGKTHLATAIGVELWEKNYTVSYKRLYDLMTEIKSTYNKSEKTTEIEIINNLVQFDLLILDEIGLKTMSETETALAYQILDKRYEEIKPTIIISNLNEKELSDNIGARTVDRLYENHGAVFVFDWDSHRRLK
jgi:DNA replication protein DnaC